MAGDSDPTSPSPSSPDRDATDAAAEWPDAATGWPDSPLDDDAVAMIVVEETAAQRRRSSIEAGRRVGGTAGAAMAGAMLAIRDVIEGPQRDEIVAVAESPGEPGDIDTEGIAVSFDGQDFWAPPPE